MKEYTVIHTVQFTTILKREDDWEPIPIRETEEQLKSAVDVDDIKVTGRQIFIRDLPNSFEVAVGTH